jgi:hypothetical protein
MMPHPYLIPLAASGAWGEDEERRTVADRSAAPASLAERWLAAHGFDASPMPVPMQNAMALALHGAVAEEGLVIQEIRLHAGGELHQVEAYRFPDGSAITATATTRFIIRNLRPGDGRTVFL